MLIISLVLIKICLFCSEKNQLSMISLNYNNKDLVAREILEKIISTTNLIIPKEQKLSQPANLKMKNYQKLTSFLSGLGSDSLLASLQHYQMVLTELKTISILSPVHRQLLTLE